jgi:hypothetical protein
MWKRILASLRETRPDRSVEGLSYYQCWQRLLYSEPKTSAGREWSLERFKRVHKRYLAYKGQLQASQSGNH